MIYVLIALALVVTIALFKIFEQLHRFKLEIINVQHDGWSKSSETFTDITKRLALIDEAQRRINDLSNNILSLKEILSDKKTRGAFGEIQLNNIIHNMLPVKNYALQHQLSNGLRCDCMLFLPPPTGNVAVDAKFPVENFQRYNDQDTNELERKKYMQTFAQDIKKHIADIATKYIVPGETANGAIMFIPAEAIFAEIHSRFPELVALAQEKGVWLTSPTTLMAVLTTASAVLKDSATREHVHCIQEHLRALSKDFSLFAERMDKLTRHIEAANQDAKQVHISAEKISKRFQAIEKVEIAEE